MELEALIRQIDGFAGWKHAQKIRFFGWFLQSVKGQSTFTAAEIRQCFLDLNLDQPSGFSPFIKSMTQKKPREMLRVGDRYCLERRLVEELDGKYGRRPTAVAVDKLLTELPTRLPNLAERTYLDETLICFRNKAFRASIVMTWNLAYDHLCEWILSKHLPEFNTRLPIRYPKADISSVAKRDDFSELKESQVLEVCRSGGVTSDAVHKILKEKLDRRNMAAHPSGVAFLQPTAEEYIRDLVENVVLKLV